MSLLALAVLCGADVAEGGRHACEDVEELACGLGSRMLMTNQSNISASRGECRIETGADAPLLVRRTIK